MVVTSDTSNPMWGGHFEQGPDAMMLEINASIDVDKALYEQDIAGSVAHANMLAKQGVLTREAGSRGCKSGY